MWVPDLMTATGPIYQAIADALASDIRVGRLSGGDRLPPQRALADELKVDFTTVRRAYAEANRRGLVEGRVGQGTYVRETRGASAPVAARSVVDMSMNFPPSITDTALVAQMWDGVSELESIGGADLFLKYQSAGGSPRDRAAGVAWLAPRFGEVALEQVLLTPGTQGALLALFSLYAKPGDTVVTEQLTYPGMRALAAHLGLNLVGLPMDRHGIDPEAFEEVCRVRKPRLLYCNPVLHNPTTITWSLERRKRIVEIARQYEVMIVEDDAYGVLPDVPEVPLAVLAPDLVFHIAGLAKALAPALRISYLVVPDGRAAKQLGSAIRATAGMVSPLTAAIATNWIENGTAATVVQAIRKESRERQDLVASLLPPELTDTDPQGFHVWLRLPSVWTRGNFIARLRAEGISVVASDAFALENPPEAVRLGLGAATSREELRQSLRTVADLLWGTPEMSTMVV